MCLQDGRRLLTQATERAVVGGVGARLLDGVTFVDASFGRPDQPTVALQLTGWMLALAR